MISKSNRITMNCRAPAKKLLASKHFHLLSCLIFILLLPQLAKCIDRRTTSQEHHHRTIASHNNPPADSSSSSDQQQATSHGSSSPSVAASSASSSHSSSASLTEDSYDQSEEHNDSLYQRPYELDLVRLNDTSVVLKWDLPFSGDNNNAADHLQFFKIQYKSTKKDTDWKTDNREIPPTTRAYQINGLRPGNYFFIVSAVYDNDDNVSSEPAKYRLRARSKIPHSEMPEQKAPVIHWSNATSEYIRFKWTYKVKDKDMQTFGYLVYYRSAHAVSDFTIYNTLDENVEIVNLEPDTPYEAKVVAYNNVGVSEFSDIIRIKTKPRSNSTGSQASENGNNNNSATNTPAIASTTTKPQISVNEKDSSDKDPDGSSNHQQQSTTSLGGSPVVSLGSRFVGTNINSTIPKSTTTPSITPIKPNLSLEGDNSTNSNVGIATTSTFSSAHKFLSQISDLLFGQNQNDTTLAIRLTLIVLLPIIFIVSGLICLMVCCNQKRRKDLPDSSTADSMQFDLGINSYFKNSFPGIEKEYSSSMASQPNGNHRNAANHGFLNNHPHINDFA